MQVRDRRRELVATVPLDREDAANMQTTSGLQWQPISLWHGVYGWTMQDGTVIVRYVPADNKCEYLITVERPIEDELRVVATGAYLLKTAGTDFVAWATRIEMRG